MELTVAAQGVGEAEDTMAVEEESAIKRVQVAHRTVVQHARLSLKIYKV